MSVSGVEGAADFLVRALSDSGHIRALLRGRRNCRGVEIDMVMTEGRWILEQQSWSCNIIGKSCLLISYDVSDGWSGICQHGKLRSSSRAVLLKESNSLWIGQTFDNGGAKQEGLGCRR